MAREQRRLAAILVTDVVGYSKLAGSDESGTLVRLHALRVEVIEPAISRHEGRLFKAMGDGFLVEFASAVQAVSCARAIQEANGSGPLPLRIGIHVGDVVVQDDDLMGDGVNVAARIEGLAEPGGIALSRQVHDQVRDRMDVAFVDKGEVALKNIARPVHVFTIVGEKRPAPTLALPDKPSIAVLPFQNMSGDPEQEYFVDGLVEDIITALSRFKSLFVIARNSSFTYKGRAVDMKQVGRELGVRYLLEGSVRKSGQRVRITGQLIEAATGTHLWADRFDGELEDIFELQDEVTQQVVTALVPTVQRAEIERARRKPVANLGTHDCYLKGLAAYQVLTKESFEEATRLFRRALELDPENASAVGMLLACDAYRRSFGSVGDAMEKEEVVRLVRLAVHIGGEDAVALGNAAWAIAFVLRDLTFANEQVERALKLNSNAATVWTHSGWISLWSGNAAKAVEHLLRSMRLDPLGHIFGRRSALAHAHFFLDQYQEALQWAESELRDSPDVQPTLRIGAASAAFAGKSELAHVLATRLRQTDPGFMLARLRDHLGPYPPDFVEKYKQGLHLAGLPE